MDSGRIYETDVRCRPDGSCYNVSIFNVDPVGINVGAPATLIPDHMKEYEDFVLSLDDDVVSHLVAWSYNLGFENGEKSK